MWGTSRITGDICSGAGLLTLYINPVSVLVHTGGLTKSGNKIISEYLLYLIGTYRRRNLRIPFLEHINKGVQHQGEVV